VTKLEAKHLPLMQAFKALYRTGDTIEVRCWDESHTVYTGRYLYGDEIVKNLKLFNEAGCDSYFVLNPVGGDLGLRKLSQGGLCTQETQIPHRRRFLLDFDPKREGKIATDTQWQAARQQAKAAKDWLESLGWTGIVLASSGNGCHLLVPCDLPNDVASKELVRKTQRVIAEKFSNAQVECECFADANRLVRAYGTVNMKGSEGDGLKHRPSEILELGITGECIPQEIMRGLIAENPVPEAAYNIHGDGEGPFTRDLLYERLHAWGQGWEGPTGEKFVFEETDRRDGFRILCPGNLSDGWPDGEQHSDLSSSLNDSTIVWCENGWPRFVCRHNHCGEGSAKGKKTWASLQNFYDPERKLHRVIAELGDPRWEIDFVDDGVQASTATKEEVEAALDVEIKEQQEPAPREGDQPLRRKLYVMPESCMYGWLADFARTLETPLGWSYPPAVTVFAARIDGDNRVIRPTLYTALIGAVHGGKSETINRAIESFVWLTDTVKVTTPGSDRGLINIFGGRVDKKKAGEANAEPPKPKTHLLALDEFRDMLNKANINGSSLPATLCSLFYKNEAGAADKNGEHKCLVRLNILGGLKANDSEEFAEVFGAETTAGLYDRMIFGIAPSGWKRNMWEPAELLGRMPSGPRVTDEIYDQMSEWRDAEKGRGRLAEIALRIGYITAAANHDKEITKKGMRCALEFAEWQEAIRENYKAGIGDAIDAQCTDAILSILEQIGGDKWVNFRDLARKRNWYRKFGAPVLRRVRESLQATGLTIEETVDADSTGRQKRTASGRSCSAIYTISVFGA
jgi:hypothetical protein